MLEKINTLPIKTLMPVAKLVCGTDYAVRFYYNKNHPKFYRNKEAFRHALRRCFTIGAFEHRQTIIQRLDLEYMYEQEQEEKREKGENT